MISIFLHCKLKIGCALSFGQNFDPEYDKIENFET